jgi:hypothetical protein
MKTQAKVNFVVALAPEARTIIRHYKLKRVHSVFPFELYKNDNIQLIVCGMGKNNAAVAAGYLAGLSGTNSSQAWINVGIAGGDVGSIGEIALAKSIADSETNKRYYPSLCFDSSIPAVEVTTVNEPTVKYKKGVLFDMEASGFYPSAVRFSTSELVQCCKIVSDNSEQSIHEISKESIVSLVENKISEIDEIAKKLIEGVALISINREIDNDFTQLANEYHFSEAQKNLLKTLLQNWHAVSEHSFLSEINANEFRNSKELLGKLKQSVCSLPLTYRQL